MVGEELIMDNIEYRTKLNSQTSKLTPEEKRWLATNPQFSERFGYPFLQSDIIIIEPQTIYDVEIVFESSTELCKITPTIAIPMNKGYIKSTELLYRSGSLSPTTTDKLYMLSTCNDALHPTSKLIVYSELGCFKVLYHCKTQDHRGYEYSAGSNIMQPLAMKREKLCPNMYRYFCNGMENSNFFDYVFTVQWKKQ